MEIQDDPQLHPTQAEVFRHPARFKVVGAGRRWGKSALGQLSCYATGIRGGRAWWIAPSYKMGAVGWRGVRLIGQQIPGAEVRLVDRLVTLPGGGSVQVRSADDPQSLRGEGLDYAVLDECAYMKSAAWQEAIRPALSDRKGGALFISTPHGLNWFRDLWLRGQDVAFPDWHSWTFKTADNPYIDPEEIEAARQTMLSRIFRQEYEADFLEDNPGALWRRTWIDEQRATQAPDLEHLVIGVDPAVTSTGDEWGIVAAGRYAGKFYVLEDASLQASPLDAANAIATLYHKLKADLVIVEGNQGMEMITTILRMADINLPVRLVTATRGKRTRAEPVSALYERGNGVHVGQFPTLEDEMCQWEPGQASPNRLDALVWAATHLMLGLQRTVLI